MSETTPEPSLYLEPDPEGDVVLRYSKLESNTSVSIRVSSKVLRLASPVFKGMLSPHFKEGQELRQEDRVVIELEDHDPSLMGLIMNILHYKAACGEPAVYAEKLAHIANYCDKYDCTGALSAWAATWLAELEKQKSPHPEHGSRLLAAYVFNDSSHFAQMSKAAMLELKPSCPLQWPDEELLNLLPESVPNAISESIQSTLDSMEAELQNAESQLRLFHKCYQTTQLVCTSCGRSLPDEAKKCHPCSNKILLQKHCTEETRVAEYFAVLRKVELWPTKGPFGECSIADITYRFACARVDLRHSCAVGRGCPLNHVLDLLVSTIEKIQEGVKGFCLVCVRHAEGWTRDTKCVHQK